MMTIKDPSHVPPGGAFVYVQPESGVEFRHHTMLWLKDLVKKHRKANDYPIGSQFDREIEDYICAHQPGICHDTTPPEKLTKLAVIMNFARSMVGWASNGFRLVTGNDFHERRVTCMGDGESKPACPHFGGETQFGYAHCGKCGCSGVKLFVKSSANGQDDCPDKRWPIIP